MKKKLQYNLFDIRYNFLKSCFTVNFTEIENSMNFTENLKTVHFFYIIRDNKHHEL